VLGLSECLRVARPMLVGKPHEAVSNGGPRWMAAGPRERVHRTRPTGQLARRLTCGGTRSLRTALAGQAAEGAASSSASTALARPISTPATTAAIPTIARIMRPQPARSKYP
jgi:hypothetical protein